MGEEETQRGSASLHAPMAGPHLNLQHTKEKALSDVTEGLVCPTEFPPRELDDFGLPYFLASEPLPKNALNRSMGIGKTTMLVRSVAISFSVPR